MVRPDRHYRRRQEPKKIQRPLQAETEVSVEPVSSEQTGLNLLERNSPFGETWCIAKLE